jgi:dihydrofolate synthase/folylpolyglutamate synthase
MPRSKRVLIFGVLADKDYRGMLATLAPLAAHVLVCEPNVSRAVRAAELRKVVRRVVAARDVSDALRRAKKLAGPNGEIVIAGSIFLVAEARAQLLGVRADPPIRM